MNTKEKKLPVFVEDTLDREFHAPDKGGSDFSGELNIGPVNVKTRSRSSDNSGLIIGGVLAGGAVAIGAVAVTLSLLGTGKSN